MDKLFTITNTACRIRPGEMDFYEKFREIKKKAVENSPQEPSSVAEVVP